MNIFRRFYRWMGFSVLTDGQGAQSPYPTVPVINGTRSITPSDALQLSTVWSCVDLISKTIASMPLLVYRSENGKRALARNSTLWYLLHDSPNAHMTSMEFWRAMVLDLALRGNAYAHIRKNSAGEAVALTPLSAEQVTMNVEVNSLGGSSIGYVYEANGNAYGIAEENMLHIKGMGKGLIGLSNLEFMRASVDEAIGMQENASALYGNGSSPKGVLMVDRQLDEVQRRKLAERYAGLQVSNEGGLYILPADMKYSQVSLSPADAQLLESRNNSVSEICRWFGVPEILVSGKADNLDSTTDLFHKATIRPIAVNVEQAIRKRVMTESQRDEFVAEFNFDALLRASITSRYEVYSRAVQNGLMTRNECRQLENNPPIAGADNLTAQNNLVPIEMLGKVDSSQTKQTPITDEVRQ